MLYAPFPVLAKRGVCMIKQEEEKNIILSINQGMDRVSMLRLDLYQFLEEVKPLHAEEFHRKCRALIQVQLNSMIE